MKIGEKFNYNGIEFICLDVIDGNYLAITAKVWQELPFDVDNHNNWKESSLRRVLNDEFLDKLNKKHLVKQTSDLIADNGDRKYGTSEDYVTILSCDQYRKYRDIVPHYPEWMWTLTPWSCFSGSGDCVRYVNPAGNVNVGYAGGSIGVAPVVLFSKEFIRDIDKDVGDCVNVVRCKNCKYYENVELLGNVCKRLFTIILTEPDDFCSKGEKQNEKK